MRKEGSWAAGAVIRTREQAAVLFPDVYSGGGPLEIPVITSVHIWQNGKPVVDCGGGNPKGDLLPYLKRSQLFAHHAAVPPGAAAFCDRSQRHL